MFTANTMSICIEALGMSLPGTATRAAVGTDQRVTARKLQDCRETAQALGVLMQKGIRARHIMTRAAFENAIVVLMALGGSTNGVLHLLALAQEAEVQLCIDDFNAIADRVPLLSNLTPSGEYNVVDFDAIGGLPPVMKTLLERGLIHGDALTGQ